MDETQLTHGSLFSGIGGFDLAAQWAGIKNIFQVEIDDYCNKVLEKNFPDVKKHRDIKSFDGTEYRERVDIVSGGFPCQPFSIAGKRRGKADDRFLWDEMLRAIREINPKWIIGENVANLWNMGLENMLTRVESEGYEVETFIIPALAVGAPHRRDRIWIIANNIAKRCLYQSDEVEPAKRREYAQCNISTKNRIVTNNGLRNDERKANKRKFTNAIIKKETLEYKRSIECDRLRIDRNSNRKRLEVGGKESNRAGQTRLSNRKNSEWNKNWYEVATKFCRVDDGISNRVDRLKSLGNAVVPQIPYILFEAIKEVSRQSEY